MSINIYPLSLTFEDRQVLIFGLDSDHKPLILKVISYPCWSFKNVSQIHIPSGRRIIAGRNYSIRSSLPDSPGSGEEIIYVEAETEEHCYWFAQTFEPDLQVLHRHYHNFLSKFNLMMGYWWRASNFENDERHGCRTLDLVQGEDFPSEFRIDWISNETKDSVFIFYDEVPEVKSDNRIYIPYSRVENRKFCDLKQLANYCLKISRLWALPPEDCFEPELRTKYFFNRNKDQFISFQGEQNLALRLAPGRYQNYFVYSLDHLLANFLSLSRTLFKPFCFDFSLCSSLFYYHELKDYSFQQMKKDFIRNYQLTFIDKNYCLSPKRIPDLTLQPVFVLSDLISLSGDIVGKKTNQEIFKFGNGPIQHSEICLVDELATTLFTQKVSDFQTPITNFAFETWFTNYDIFVPPPDFKIAEQIRKKGSHLKTDRIHSTSYYHTQRGVELISRSLSSKDIDLKTYENYIQRLINRS